MTSMHRRSFGTSRRGFLVGAGLAVVGAAAGVGAGVLVDRSPDHVDVPSPQLLLGAVAAERALLATVTAALASGASRDALLRQVRADHAAHLQALLAVATLANGAQSPSATLTPTRPAAAVTLEQVRAAEQAAASAAARRALALTGRDAALLASISACEATHVELLA